MNQAVARQIATKINGLVNLPFINEEQEQAFFEMIVLIVLETLLGQLHKELDIPRAKTK